mmetsp:Transcript_103112/g.298265  ORF Transcript_103112/g.298265 Transcript_103112/m.298265 type:complete len:200 (-) Transcript_103112:989-1588(-)
MPPAESVCGLQSESRSAPTVALHWSEAPAARSTARTTTRTDCAAHVAPELDMGSVVAVATCGRSTMVMLMAAPTPAAWSSVGTTAAASSAPSAAMMAEAYWASGAAMSYSTVTGPARRRRCPRRRAAPTKHFTSMSPTSLPLMRARAWRRPTITAGSAQKASGSATSILKIPATTTLRGSPGVVGSLGGSGSTKPTVGS